MKTADEKTKANLLAPITPILAGNTRCVYLLMMEYNMLKNAFQSIGLAYKYLLTLFVTQVGCERAFSILKIIKMRLRYSLAQSNLESFMLMMDEHEISLTIDNEYIIEQVASSSQAYARILKRR